MSEIIVLVGNIWSGKSTYAKWLNKMENGDHAYFDFDKEFHYKIQQLKRPHNELPNYEQEIEWFFENLNKFLGKWKNNVVIDGFFSWMGEFYDKDKFTLDQNEIWNQFLALSNINDRKIVLVYCVQKLDVLKKRFKVWNGLNFYDNSSDQKLIDDYAKICLLKKKAIENTFLVDKFVLMNDSWNDDYVECVPIWDDVEWA